MEKKIEIDKSTHMAFLDLEKAFDKINWKLLFMSLQNAGIDWKDRKFFFNFYKNQATVIEVNGHKEEAKIRQGCSLSPYLFKLFIVEAINEMKINTNGISTNGQKIDSIRFADDIALIAESAEELNFMLNYLDIALTKFNLKININKTKVLIVSTPDQH
jgi:hypothetical protein